MENSSDVRQIQILENLPINFVIRTTRNNETTWSLFLDVLIKKNSSDLFCFILCYTIQRTELCSSKKITPLLKYS